MPILLIMRQHAKWRARNKLLDQNHTALACLPVKYQARSLQAPHAAAQITGRVTAASDALLPMAGSQADLGFTLTGDTAAGLAATRNQPTGLSINNDQCAFEVQDT